jgi:hypothetical protein
MTFCAQEIAGGEIHYRTAQIFLFLGARAVNIGSSTYRLSRFLRNYCDPAHRVGRTLELLDKRGARSTANLDPRQNGGNSSHKTGGGAMTKRIDTIATGLFFGLILALPSSTLAAPPDFPMWCRGIQGMASTSGKNLIIDFRPANGPAGNGLEPGQCSWLDRSLRPNEPRRIVNEEFAPATARQIAGMINSGQTWTFWVFNVGRFFHGTADSKGAAHQKPGVL